MFEHDRDRFVYTEERPNVVGYCAVCGEPIEQGDPIWTDPNGDIYHRDCFEDNVFDIIRDYFFKDGDADA